MMRILTTIIFLLSVHVAKTQDTTRLSLMFIGDIMQHGTQITDAYDPVTKKHNYDPCFQFVKPYLQSADLTIGNLELTLAGPPYRGYPQFSAPDELLQTLKSAGFDVLVTANNHCVDTGKKGLERTIMMLDSLDIAHTGTFSEEVVRLNDYPLIVEKKGFRLSVLNYTFSTNGLPVHKPNIVNMIDTAQIRKDLVKAKAQKTDAIIVFTHWGVEYESLPRKNVIDLTDFCFKHGAQLVIGAHPHVIQPMEWRKEKNQLITYSLGNFVSGQRKRYTDGGAMIRVELEKIAHKPDSSITTIDSAGYILEWIYRTVDARKDYFILPVPSFENDTAHFVKDAASALALKTFIADSRKLFKQHNKDVGEIKTPVPDVLQKYLQLDSVRSHLRIRTTLNQFYLQGDFDGDKKTDFAVAVQEMLNQKSGFVIWNSGANKYEVVGCGKPLSNNARDNYDPFTDWETFDRQVVEQGVAEGEPPVLLGDAILVIKAESSSGLIYWTGKEFAWYQQGD